MNEPGVNLHTQSALFIITMITQLCASSTAHKISAERNLNCAIAGQFWRLSSAPDYNKQEKYAKKTILTGIHNHF